MIKRKPLDLKPFEQLTERQQLNRLRQLVRAVLQHYNLNVTALSLLRKGANLIFRVDSGQGERYSLRLNHPATRSLEEIKAGLEWMAALGRETDLRLPQPLSNRQGNWITTQSIAGVPEARYGILFSWLEGHRLIKRPTRTVLYQQGVLMARLHQHSTSFKVPANIAPRQLAAVWPDGRPDLVYSDEPDPIFTPLRRAMLRQLANRVQTELDCLANSSQKKQMLHGDLNLGNLLGHRGNLGVIDFDLSGLGYAIQDIGIAFYYLHGKPDYQEWLAAFKAGYSSVLSWPEEYEGQLEIFKIARQLELLNFLVSSTLPEIKAMLPQWLEWAEPQMQFGLTLLH